MLVGAAAASNTIDCVVDNIKTVVAAASAAAVPLESALDVRASMHIKMLRVAGGSGCEPVCSVGVSVA